MTGKIGAAMENLAGKRFGRLTLIEAESRKMPSGRRQVYWLCQCDCGNKKLIRPQQIKEGRTVSCGCKQAEDYKKKADNSYCQTEEYKILQGMKARCYNPDNSAYCNYGGRGIKVCDRWVISGREGYLNFVNDLGERPSISHSIERIDVNGDYSPDNCIWTADRGLQSYNRRPLPNKLGCEGVGKVKRGYIARISFKGERIYLGFFKTYDKAVLARKAAELKYYGFNKEDTCEEK